MTRMRGRVYEDGPYTFCDNFDYHGIGCTCAAPPLSVRDPSNVLRVAEFRPLAVIDLGCYWPIEDAEGQA